LNRRSTGTTSFNKIRLNVTSLRVDSKSRLILCAISSKLFFSFSFFLAGTKVCPSKEKRKEKKSFVSFSVFPRLGFLIDWITGHDFTFARLVRGHQMVGYGEAGDCYSTANCPQGRFSINLQGTGLRVSPHTSWAGHGHRSSLWINRLEVNDNNILHHQVETFLIVFKLLNFFA
jgi:hypothetical protein